MWITLIQTHHMNTVKERPHMNLVWQSMLDEVFDCRVVHTAPYRGRLTVTDTSDSSVLMEKEVNLSYDAKFGPDVLDVESWQQMCVNAVDNRTK